MENNEEIDIKRIIEIIFSKKLIITLIILLSVTLGYVYSYYYKKPEYKSSVTILLVADENKTDKSLTQTDVNLNNGLISTYSSIAKSSSILQKTIQNLNLDIPVSKLEQNVEAKQIDNTQFLEISVKNESPERAKNIANELAEVFTEQIKEIYNLQNISIVDKAETEENPCNINHMKDMIIFGFAGIVLSIIIVMIIYMFDDTVKDQKDIEKNIKLRTIGTLPVDREKTELIVENNPKSPIVESIKTIRTNILYSTRKNSILVTSCKEKEGKSWVINNLAVTFAQADNKVILIDADMRKGRQYTIFGASPRPGLSNYLSGMDVEDGQEPDVTDYLQKTDIENLLIMTAGNIPPNPSELLVSPQMNKLLEDLKQACDIIIIDGTPCELVTDSVILSRIVDSTVIVTAHKETKKENLEKIIRNIQHVGGHLAGIVVNKMPISVKKYNEKYYYNSATGSTLNQTTSRREIKEKASNILKQNDDMYKEKKIEQRKSNKTNMNDDYESENKMEKPSFIKNNNSGVDLDRSKDILNQINSYLDNEKKNLR